MEMAGEGLTAGLVKGLRLFDGVTDLSEEGMGFGVPVIVNRYRTYLSYNARVTESTKVFIMDAVQTMPEAKAPGILPYIWLEAKGRLYKSFPPAQHIMLRKRLTGNLTPRIGFSLCQSQCEITVSYEKDSNGAKIKADLTGLADMSGSPKVFMLNEQGGRSFPFYWEQGADSEEQGQAQVKISEAYGWKKVDSEEAGFVNVNDSVCFSLSQVPGAVMFRGREVAGDTLSWSGLDYDVTSLIGSGCSYRVSVKSDSDDFSLR